MREKQSVVVAMSGGVDSSTVAALMIKRGHKVIGATLRICPKADTADAEKVAKELGIEHHVLDFKKEFNESIVSYFVDTYENGETPNPCVKCNKEMKFGRLYDFAMRLGAQSLVTGHYVRKIETEDGETQLHKALDPSKDQSYFLYAIDKAKLKHLEFPLGDMKKSDVRAMAKSYGLSVADKPDSQNLEFCFVPDKNYAKVISEYKEGCETFTGLTPGNIKDSKGNVLGRHKGLIHYTVGQRRGLGISGLNDACYVTKLDRATNTVTVGTEDELKPRAFYIRDLNWFVDPATLQDQTVTVKVRSAHVGSNAIIALTTDSNKYKVTPLDQFRSIAPGQACVIYCGTQVLGGGTISSEKVS